MNSFEDRKIRAAVLKGRGKIEIQSVEIPPIGDEDVLIKIKAVGICGSDIHQYADMRIGKYSVPAGHILGHEAAGEIVETGKSVKDRKIGDKVVIEPGLACLKCNMCKEGRYNLCDNVVFLNHPDPSERGTMVEYVALPSYFTHIMPDDMTYEEGAIIEPLSVAVHAVRRAVIDIGKSVAIIGCGPIGLNILSVAKALGCTNICALDIFENRIEFAKKIGADYIYNTGTDCWKKRIFKETERNGFDIVFEATGSQEAYEYCTYLVKRGGTIVFIGMGKEKNVPFNVFEIIEKEADVKGSFRYANDFECAIKYVSSKKINVRKMITHKFPFEKTDEAMKQCVEKKNEVIKAVLIF